MTRRIYVVGTGTGVGKTALCCSLLHWARRHGVPAVPFKPAQSGPPGPDDDVHRLLRAAGLPESEAGDACPWTFADPLAPGLAEDPGPFFRPPAANAAPVPPVLDDTRTRLSALAARHAAQLVLIEGAGGLHVPMPGGTWQPVWIRALATDVIVVGSAELGTINHTLLTLDALTALELPVAGFVLSETTPDADPSRDDNPQVIATARSVRYLGTLAYQSSPDAAGSVDLLTPLLDAL
jgi:dethiobiotin synthetase